MSQFDPNEFDFKDNNSIYVVVEKNDICSHVTKGIIASYSYNLAKKHLRPGREIIGPIPIIDRPKNNKFFKPPIAPRFDPIYPTEDKPKFWCNPDDIDL